MSDLALAIAGSILTVLAALVAPLLLVATADRPARARRRTCNVLHRTAALERELYGEVVSASVAGHLASCAGSWGEVEHFPMETIGARREPPHVCDKCDEIVRDGTGRIVRGYHRDEDEFAHVYGREPDYPPDRW